MRNFIPKLFKFLLYCLFQELPEQWNNTKKIALNVKQLVAPLQAAEVLNIRRKIIVFDNRQNHYRDRFKKMNFFKYELNIVLYSLNENIQISK